jgi:hypothetical protein
VPWCLGGSNLKSPGALVPWWFKINGLGALVSWWFKSKQSWWFKLFKNKATSHLM